MNVEIIRCLQDNYSYLIIDKKTNSACVVDPSESKPIIEYLDKHKIKLIYILNTHHHYDHIGGNKELKKKYKAKVVGYAEDKNRIPGIDICLKDQEIWSKNNFAAKNISSNFIALSTSSFITLNVSLSSVLPQLS